MSVTSCQQRILLRQAYYNIPALPVDPSSVVNVDEAILYAFFVQNRSLGLSESEVIAYLDDNFPQYDLDTVQAAFLDLVRGGVLVILQPLCINWCQFTCPEKTYAINKQLERLIPWGDLLMFLIQLAGGTQVSTPTFRHWFAPDRDLQGSLTFSTKRSVLPNAAW